MYKIALRTSPRRLLASQTALLNVYKSSGRRLLSTAPPAKKSRSWKGAAARWGLAAAGIYYYNTSNAFAEEPDASIQQAESSLHAIQEANQPTIDAIVEEKRLRLSQEAAEEEKRQKALVDEISEEGEDGAEEGERGVEGLDEAEEDGGQQGAFNPETGEINWDCPCLGGMAHGTCGEEFRAAFSCFVYSKEEPKGVECIEKFKGMQDCFRAHPDEYGPELEDEEDEIEEELHSRETGVEDGAKTGDASSKSTPKPSLKTAEKTPAPSLDTQPASGVKSTNSQSTTKDTTLKIENHVGDESGESVHKVDATSK